MKKLAVASALAVIGLLACRELPTNEQRNSTFIHVPEFGHMLDSLTQQAFNMALFPKIRKEITREGFRLLGIVD